VAGDEWQKQSDCEQHSVTPFAHASRRNSGQGCEHTSEESRCSTPSEAVAPHQACTAGAAFGQTEYRARCAFSRPVSLQK
jgi:hypothetical protein